MKKSILVFFAFSLLVSFSYAHNGGDLKGPKAKNNKAWENNQVAESNIASIETTVERVTGPEAKNAKNWKSQESEESYEIVLFMSPSKPKGPKAKNRKF